LENVLSFGIPSKKYVLFKYNADKFMIHKFTSHRLEYLLDIDEKNGGMTYL